MQESVSKAFRLQPLQPDCSFFVPSLCSISFSSSFSQNPGSHLPPCLLCYRTYLSTGSRAWYRSLSVHPFLPPLPTKPVSSHPSVYHTFISVCFRGHVPFSTPPGVTCHARESNWLCHHSNLGLNPASAISQHVIFIPPSQGTHCDHV